MDAIDSKLGLGIAGASWLPAEADDSIRRLAMYGAFEADDEALLREPAADETEESALLLATGSCELDAEDAVRGRAGIVTGTELGIVGDVLFFMAAEMLLVSLDSVISSISSRDAGILGSIAEAVDGNETVVARVWICETDNERAPT